MLTVFQGRNFFNSDFIIVRHFTTRNLNLIPIMAQRLEYLKSMWKMAQNTNNFAQCLKNVEILSIGDGKCKAQFTVLKEHTNIYGGLNGGFTSTVIDTLSVYALMTAKSGNIQPGLSVDLHIMFLNSAIPGETVTVDARTIQHGKTMNFVAVELTKNNGKDIIARGQHTVFVKPPKTE
ncbi:acyl-coenzyme A thioesterase 13-like [Pseudomyrmex gracilis]|uniref:acyl-coenzyme A thioesterase 13-like n=1 Tax=Pseudomyrmex gracilis TaxID=219809 RepID=UPI000994B4C5|nr:acyl-coenzyme A thioesterase 13-like [Pseudomyrmex gracilis]